MDFDLVFLHVFMEFMRPAERKSVGSTGFLHMWTAVAWPMLNSKAEGVFPPSRIL
jgi:hypothetical protein